MPELPEVETVRVQLEPLLVGRTVVEAGSHPSAKFLPARETVGRRFDAVGRRGKFLILSIGDGGGNDKGTGPASTLELVVHLGMTGRLTVVDRPANQKNPYLRAWWAMDDGATLEFHDVRRFGRIRLVDPGDYQSIPTLAHAGPEPFDPDFDGRAFWELLRRSRRPIKTQLLSQRPVAGVGNIYADEALWLARINPKVRRLGRERASVLLDAIRDVLELGLRNGGTTLRDYRQVDGTEGSNQNQLNAYGRGSYPCPRCSATLKSDHLDGRTTTWCPQCQRT
ncbi:MAG: bifunctional DNA-formamidopyrimidine glycosylase/DNA-(apurinic or apyrimidinic site) lyase [Acidimicrobiia bacterium]|nr:bifunctional DNA-formamidopyrimidine glycosylase/DNA-(apurinic or apyrimidinic site) lyase [Acidimicrobiia bacterium]